MADKPEVLVARCLRDFEEDEQVHRVFVQAAHERYDAYRGVLELSSEAAAWSSRQAPKFVFQVIETMTANLLDPTPVWRLKARPRLDSIESVERYRDGARANELLLAEQLETDHYAEKQRAFGLQGLITGLTVKKNHWLYREGMVREQRVVEEQVFDPELGIPITRPRLRDMAYRGPVRSDPTTEVVNVEDFIWHQAARSLDKCLRVTHRIWLSYPELEAMAAQGVYGPKVGGQPIEGLKESRDQSHQLDNRPRDLHYGADRTKDQIELLECWIDGGQRVVTIANRKLLLRDRPNPFWFDRLEHPYPFVVASATPDLFVIPGVSEVEVMMDIQEMLWSLLNQQLDAQQLMANVITLVRDDVDTTAFEWAPGEYWSVPGDVNTAVRPLDINPAVGEITTATFARLKDDLQNIPGAAPTLLGQVDPSTQTATEVSLTTTLAQRRVLAKKMQFSWAQKRDGEQWIALNQQFLRRPRIVQIIGEGGAEDFFEVRPEMIQGPYAIELAAQDESLMRQERRAEKVALLNLTLNSLGAFAALAQANPQVKVPNPQMIYDEVLEVYGVVGDKSRYYMSVAPPPEQLPPAGQDGGPQEGGPLGATAPQATDMNSPSNQFSQSPLAALQQLLAASGGRANA